MLMASIVVDVIQVHTRGVNKRSDLFRKTRDGLKFRGKQ
jgi:hypothetical protein